MADRFRFQVAGIDIAGVAILSLILDPGFWIDRIASLYPFRKTTIIP